MLKELLVPGGEVVCLINPQFEAGREKVGKKGVVRDKKVHEEVIREVLGFAGANGFKVLGLDYSPVKGPEGNIEYLMHIRKTDMESGEDLIVYGEEDIEKLVSDSHDTLDK